MVPMPRASAPAATASSSALVLMGLAVGSHRSNCTSGPQSSADEVADLVGGLCGRDRVGLTRPHGECTVDLLADEDHGALGIEVGAEVPGGHARPRQLLE